MPRFARIVRHARKSRRVLAPLFPRYLFLILDIERDRWHRVNGTFGVASMVMSRDRPQAAPKGVVEDADRHELADAASRTWAGVSSRSAPGQKVRLAAGPFASQLGVLENLDDGGRVRVLLQIMGAWRSVRVSREDVLPVG